MTVVDLQKRYCLTAGKWPVVSAAADTAKQYDRGRRNTNTPKGADRNIGALFVAIQPIRGRPPAEPKEPAPATLDLASLVEQLQKSPELASALAALIAAQGTAAKTEKSN